MVTWIFRHYHIVHEMHSMWFIGGLRKEISNTMGKGMGKDVAMPSSVVWWRDRWFEEGRWSMVDGEDAMGKAED